MDRESIRKSFRPSPIRVLFVGESPPANGGFFYVNSPMTTYMSQVFSQVYGKEFHSINDFLNFFKAEGYYLDDLSYTPVNNLPPSERKKSVNSCVGALAERMEEYKPEHVIAFLMSIEEPVRKAAQIAKLHVSVHAVPFPGLHHQSRFVAELSEILKSIL